MNKYTFYWRSGRKQTILGKSISDAIGKIREPPRGEKEAFEFFYVNTDDDCVFDVNTQSWVESRRGK